jgi:hypothetical protein
MDINLRAYSADDWLRFQPAIHALKTIRYWSVDRLYRRRPARTVLMRDEAQSFSGTQMLVAIAFEDAELIDWQARLIRKNVQSTRYIVVDNSNSETGAAAIQNVCERQGCCYVRTPKNPWFNSPSRSHGLALNWAWENVVKPCRPKAFGFIDADLLPLESTDPFALLDRQDFYGVVRNVDARWFLWAGFCMFKFSAVEQVPLDFGQAWFLGLDTGGANWNVLYRHYDLSTLEHMPTFFFPYKNGLAVSEGTFQKCGPWIHEVGQMGRPELARDKRAALRCRVEPLLG